MKKRIAKKRYKKVLHEVAMARAFLKGRDKLLEQKTDECKRYAHTIDLQEVEIINLKNSKAILENRLTSEIKRADNLFVENRQLTAEVTKSKKEVEYWVESTGVWRNRYLKEKSKPWYKKIFRKRDDD